MINIIEKDDGGRRADRQTVDKQDKASMAHSVSDLVSHQDVHLSPPAVPLPPFSSAAASCFSFTDQGSHS